MVHTIVCVVVAFVVGFVFGAAIMRAYIDHCWAMAGMFYKEEGLPDNIMRFPHAK